MNDEPTLVDQPKRESIRASKVAEGEGDSIPTTLSIKNSPRLWEFLKTTGDVFERSPEEHARELLVDLMRRFNEANVVE